MLASNENPLEPARRDRRASSPTRLSRVRVQPLPGPDGARAARAHRRGQRARAEQRARRQRRRRAHLRPAARVGRARAQAARHAADVRRCTASTPRSPAREVVRDPAHGGLLGRRGGGARRGSPRATSTSSIDREPEQPHRRPAPETFLIDLLKATDALVLVDEAYFEFSPAHDAPAHDAPPEPRHPAHVLQGVLARGPARRLPARARGRHAASSRRCASRTRWTAFTQMVARDRLPRARGVREPASATSSAAATGCCTGWRDARRGRGLPDRGELRAVPRRARAGGLARPAPQPLGARARLLAQRRGSRTACG